MISKRKLRCFGSLSGSASLVESPRRRKGEAQLQAFGKKLSSTTMFGGRHAMWVIPRARPEIFSEMESCRSWGRNAY